MAIPHLEEAKWLREEGKRLGRAGMSEFALSLVAEFEAGPKTYTGVMILAGKLKAVAHAAKCDDYWDEQVAKGYQRGRWGIRSFPSPTTLEEE